MKTAHRAAAALLICSFVHNAISFPAASLMEQEMEGDETRKVLGSSVVTSVSVIMDLGNGSQAFADSTGRPVPKPASAAHLSSPPSLMSPDRYEFYTFNDAGDLVKRLMTMDEIQGLIAGESVEIGSDLPGIDPEEVQADHVEERPPAFFFLPHPMERNPDWAPPGVDKVVKRVQDVLADVQNKITTEDHQQPSWAINRPVAHDAPSYPTQNIPGSTLQFLKNPADKINTFVPPSYLLVSEKPSTDETDKEDGRPLVVADEQILAPSSTPTLSPVSQTFAPSSTTNFVGASSSQVPISTTLSSTTTLASITTPAAPVTVKKTALSTTASTSTVQPTASPNIAHSTAFSNTAQHPASSDAAQHTASSNIAQHPASSNTARPTAFSSTTTRLSASDSTTAVPSTKQPTTVKIATTPGATTQFIATQYTTPKATTTQSTTRKATTTQSTTTEMPSTQTTTTQSPRPQTTTTPVRTTKPTASTPLLRISTFANTPPPTTTSTTVGIVASSSSPTRSTTTEKSTTSKLQLVSTTNTIKDIAFEKIPEISVKLPSDQSVIKIPSTIIADLLIEDQQEVIRHDSLSSSSTVPDSVEISTSKTTQKPSISSATSRPPSPVVSSIKLSSSEKVQGHYITSTSNPKTSSIKTSSSSTPQPVTVKYSVSSSAAPQSSSTINIVTTAMPKEKLTTADIKLTTLLMNAMKNNAISSMPFKSSTKVPVVEIVPDLQTEKIPAIAKPEQVLEAIQLKTVSTPAPNPSTTPMTFVKTGASTPLPQKIEATTIKQVLVVKKNSTSSQNTIIASSAPSNTFSVQNNNQKTTLPPIEDFRVQMDQITQSLTDKKTSSVKPLPMTSVVTKKPALALAASTFASFGTSSVASNFRQTGKTTPPPLKTTQRVTALPSTKVTLRTTTITAPTDGEITTESYLYETQMTTLNIPPVADSLVLEDATSKTSELELNSPDHTSEQSNLFNDLETLYPGESKEDETERFESTERLESHDVVPFLSQLYNNKQTNYESSSSEEKSTEESSSSEEDVTEKVAVENDATTQKISTQTATTTYVKVATKSPNAPTTEQPRVSPTSMNAKSTTKAPTITKTSSPTYEVLNLTVVTPTSKPTAITMKPIVAQTISNDTKLQVTDLVQGGSNTNKTQNKPAEFQQIVTNSGFQSSSMIDKKENDSDNMMLLSTTEFSVRPNTLKHASTVRIDTKGQSYTHSVSTKPGNVVDKNNFKEVLDHLLAPAGILNFGDSSEESMKEDIYTTFIPASTTVKNTAPNVADEKVVNNTKASNNKNFTSTVQSSGSVDTSSGSTTNKLPMNENKFKPTTAAKPATPTSIKVTTEKIPDLEVSWQEPPEVVWTAEKASSATKKPATNVKYTTTRPTKINQTATKPTESTTKQATTNMELQSEFTKSNEDGMELIAVSDKTKPSTPSFGVRPITNRPIQSILNLRPATASNLGLEATTVMLDEDIRRFIDLNNDIAIRLYKHTTSELDTKRSIAISPFGATSLIGMVFIGSRGQTSAQINDFLPFDDMITFNPHLVMRNITDSVIMSPELRSAAIVRQLYSQKGTKEPLEFYKARAGAFYDGVVQQINFDDASKIVKERTNELVKMQTSNKVPEFLGDTAVLRFRPPFAAQSANVFQMNCALSSSQGSRDGEMIFHSDKLEETHTLPAAVWSGEFMVGYDVGLDATAVEIPHSNSPGGALTSSVFVMPGKPGSGNNGGVPLLGRLEARLISRRAWSGLLRNLQRSEEVVDIQIPRFEHRSVLNLTVPLERMGLNDLFKSGVADLGGVNGMQDLYLTDLTQMNVFSFCSTPEAEGHVETYPSTKRMGRLGSRGGEDYEDEYDWRSSGVISLPLPLRPRQGRIPMSENPRIKFDRPFMYFVRHNPTGMILHIGRFNPRFGS